MTNAQHRRPRSRGNRPDHRLRRVAIAVGVIGALVALGVAFVKLSSTHGPAPPTTTAGVGPLDLTSPPSLKIEPWTLIATLLGPTPGFATSTSATPSQLLPAEWSGAASALPVIESKNGRLEVRLLLRPNGVTAWIPSSAASVSRTPFHVVVDLEAMQLLFFNEAKLVMRAPAGVGVDDAPTPPGNYFVAELAEAPNPGYGSFVIVTSAFANTVTDWEQNGDAMITINGPLGTDALIRSHGAAVSRGSIRLLDPDLVRLRVLPLGTPVDVVATYRPLGHPTPA